MSDDVCCVVQLLDSMFVSLGVRPCPNHGPESYTSKAALAWPSVVDALQVCWRAPPPSKNIIPGCGLRFGAAHVGRKVLVVSLEACKSDAAGKQPCVVAEELASPTGHRRQATVRCAAVT